MKKVFITFFLVIILDQILKVYVKLNFAEGIYSGIDIIPGVIELAFVENPGMAFGWQLPFDAGKIILTLFRIVAAGVIFWYIRKLLREGAPKGLIICVSLILAGAFGNIIDSAFYGLIFSESNPVAVAFPEGGGYGQFLKGYVVDMLHFTVRWPEWVPRLGGNEIFPPIFNVADAAISVGVTIILLKQRKFFPRVEESKSPVVEIKAEAREEEIKQPPKADSHD